MKKIVKDGKVAVAVSYGFGAGWSTWTDANPMDGEFNQFIIDKDIEGALKWAKERSYYDGGIEDIKIVWVDEGDSFNITEYDGSEGIEVNPQVGYRA